MLAYLSPAVARSRCYFPALSPVLDLESGSQDLGGFPLKSYETVRRKTNTDWEKQSMGEWVDQKDISRITLAGLWEQALLLFQHDCKLWGCGQSRAKQIHSAIKKDSSSSSCLGVQTKWVHICSQKSTEQDHGSSNCVSGVSRTQTWMCFPVCVLEKWTLILEGERECRRWRLATYFENLEKLEEVNIFLVLWTWLLS